MMGIWVVGYYKTINILEARQDGINSYYMAKIYSRDTEQARLHTDPRNMYTCVRSSKKISAETKSSWELGVVPAGTEDSWS